jgi:RNA repair pathway DNA polymerase beta family
MGFPPVTPVGQDRPVLEIPPLPDSTILLVEVGSTAHGTGLPGGEDHDEMGVVVEPPTQVLGVGERGMRSVMQRTQPEGPVGPGRHRPHLALAATVHASGRVR